jgi:hypothetical protein
MPRDQLGCGVRRKDQLRLARALGGQNPIHDLLIEAPQRSQSVARAARASE